MTPSETSARLSSPATGYATSPADVKPRQGGGPPKEPSTTALPLRKSHRDLERPPFECVALVLQGGGALGAFQAGVYQGLVEANMHPDWVAGISVGAINAALIAGNSPETRIDKLRAFWDLVTTPRAPDMWAWADEGMRGVKKPVAP